MKEICEGLPAWGHVLVWIALLSLEFVMGETKFGSTIRFIFQSIASIVKRIKEEKK